MTREAVIQKYLGLPFLHQGRSLAGIDCYGLVVLIYRDMGFELWDLIQGYKQKWAARGEDYFVENYHRQWKRTIEPGLFDLVLFNNRRAAVDHAGIYLGRGQFIHCHRTAGVILSRLYQREWRERLHGFYRLKGKRNDNG